MKWKFLINYSSNNQQWRGNRPSITYFGYGLKESSPIQYINTLWFIHDTGDRDLLCTAQDVTVNIVLAWRWWWIAYHWNFVFSGSWIQLYTNKTQNSPWTNLTTQAACVDSNTFLDIDYYARLGCTWTYLLLVEWITQVYLWAQVLGYCQCIGSNSIKGRARGD